MLSYAPLWKTMENKGVTTYALINRYGIHPHTIYDLKRNRSISLSGSKIGAVLLRQPRFSYADFH